MEVMVVAKGKHLRMENLGVAILVIWGVSQRINAKVWEK